MSEDISEIKSKLDILWQSVAEFRSSENFMRIMKACKRLRTLAPYNAMMVNMQRPGAQYVQTPLQWKEKYGREIKNDANPLIILVPFGPVEYVFDIGDTKPSGNQQTLFSQTDEYILNQIAEPYKTKGALPILELMTLKQNLQFHGISLNENFQTGAGYAAKIQLSKKPEKIDVSINREKVLWNSSYQISVKSGTGLGQEFASICHELGHLFCHHLSMPADWKEKPWKVRHVDHVWEEFEAESVAWLVCERLGIDNPSKDYLAKYMPANGSPNFISQNVSIENILTATNEVEKMFKPIKYRDGLLYKHCKPFQDLCKQVTDNAKYNK